MEEGRQFTWPRREARHPKAMPAFRPAEPACPRLALGCGLKRDAVMKHSRRRTACWVACSLGRSPK